jgi:serine protease inhibitor
MHIRDFCENKSVVENEMSQWVSDRTNRFLKCAPEVSETDAIVAINTVYFKGIWNDAPITPSHELPFYNRNGSVADCKYLRYTEKELPYFENKYFQAVKLFYQNAGYSLIVILPNRKMRSMETETMAKIVSDTVNRQQPQENKNNLLSTDYHFKVSSQVEQISIADKLKKEAAGIKFSMKEQVEQFSLAGKLKKNKEPAYFYDFSQLSGNKECMFLKHCMKRLFPKEKKV